jgi:hypothetical protein
MNTKVKILLLGAGLLIGLAGCQNENYSLGPFQTPSNIQVTPALVGVSTSMPNGDGSGTVLFTISATNAEACKVDFGDGSSPVFLTNLPDTLRYTYNKKTPGVNKYGVTVTAYGVAGATPTASITDSITVFYAYHVDPAILAMLTNDSPTGKRWMVDSTVVGNMGLGPVTSYTPDYYAANPGDKTGSGLYTNVYTFTNQGQFVDSTYNKIFGSIVYFDRDFQNPAPGVFGGYGNDWILYWPTYTASYTFSGTTASANSTGVLINFTKPGSLGYYTGTQQFEILSITNTSMSLRTVQSGVGLAYYVILKAK